MGPTTIRVAIAPSGVEVPVHDVVIYDHLDSLRWAPGDLVLGVGVGSAGTSLLPALAEARASALVVVHQHADLEALTAEAGACGVALLTVSKGTPWAQLVVLLKTLVTQGLLDGSEPPDASAPGDMFAAANAVADLIDAPITIEDPHSRLLAFSARQEDADPARTATILGQRVPEAYRAELRRRGVFQRLMTETQPIYVPIEIPDLASRMVVPLRAEGQFLGSMWAITDEPFSNERSVVFADAAKFVSLRLLQSRLKADIERQQQAQLLDCVFAGGTGRDDAARRLRITGPAFRVLAASIKGPHPTEYDAALNRCWNVLSMNLVATHRGAASARLGDVVYAVIPAPDLPSRTLASAWRVEAALRTEPKLHDRLIVAIGGHCRSIAELTTSRTEADQVLRVLRDGNARQASAEIDEVWVQVMLLNVADVSARLPSTGRSRLATIETYDAQHGTSYLTTLRTYLSSFGDPTLASAQLGVHTNTLRYRLRRLADLFEIDLTNEDERLGLMLQLRLSGR